MELSEVKKYLENYRAVHKKMDVGRNYYNGVHDILKKKRLAIGENGELVELTNLPNLRFVDNQYAKLADQKKNYILSLPPTIKSSDSAYQKLIEDIFNLRFLRTLNKIALDVFNCSIGWLYVYMDKGEFKYKKLNPREITPVWEDEEREKLKAVIREYVTGKMKHLDVYTEEGVYRYSAELTALDYKFTEQAGYLQDDNEVFSYGKIPFVYFKVNNDDGILLDKVKSLQDGINSILSIFGDRVTEDTRDTVLVLKNYDGTNLDEFRRNLNQYGAIKVQSYDGASGGGVETLNITVNHENYNIILQLLKQKLIENGRGIDTKNDKTTQAPNELNIKGMYSDIELDTNDIELEFSASFEYLQYFIKKIYKIPESLTAQIQFKRNIMVNNESVVDILLKSQSMLSQKTILAKHPYVNSVSEELANLKSEVDGAIEFDMFGDRADEEKAQREINS